MLMPLDYLYYLQFVQKTQGLVEYHHISGEIEVMVLHKFGPIILLQVDLKMVNVIKSLSIKIDILASLGISILIPDIPLTSVFVQSIIIF